MAYEPEQPATPEPDAAPAASETEAEAENRIGTVLVRVTLYGNVDDKPTLSDLTDIVEDAIDRQLGLDSNATAEWT